MHSHLWCGPWLRPYCSTVQLSFFCPHFSCAEVWIVESVSFPAKTSRQTCPHIFSLTCNLVSDFLWEKCGASGGKPTQFVCHQHLNTDTKWQCKGQISRIQSIESKQLQQEVQWHLIFHSSSCRLSKPIKNNTACSVHYMTFFPSFSIALKPFFTVVSDTGQLCITIP